MNNELYHLCRSITSSTTNLSLSMVDGEMEYNGVAMTQPKIYELLGITEEVAALIFDAYSIPQLSGNARKQVLQRFFSASGNDALKKYLADQGFSKLPEEHLKSILGAYATTGLGTVEKGAYGYAVAKRRSLKRDIDTLNQNNPVNSNVEDFGKSVKTLRDELQVLGMSAIQRLNLPALMRAG